MKLSTVTKVCDPFSIRDNLSVFFVPFSENIETVREACRSLKVEDVRLPSLGPVIMHQLKTEEVDFPPLEKVMATKIFSHPDFHQERKWWGKAGKDPHHILAEAAATTIQGMRAVTVSPEEGGKQTKVEWATLPNVLAANEAQEVDVVWVEVEGNADKVELIAHWVGSRLEETSILLSGEATEVEQAITLVGEQVGHSAYRVIKWTVSSPSDEGAVVLPRFPSKREGYNGLALLTTLDVAPSRMLMILHTPLNALPFLAALRCLPKGGDDESRCLIWVPNPKRSLQRTVAWLAQIVLADEQWQPSFVREPEPLVDQDVALLLSQEVRALARASTPIPEQVEALYAKGYLTDPREKEASKEKEASSTRTQKEASQPAPPPPLPEEPPKQTQPDPQANLPTPEKAPAAKPTKAKEKPGLKPPKPKSKPKPKPCPPPKAPPKFTQGGTPLRPRHPAPELSSSSAEPAAKKGSKDRGTEEASLAAAARQQEEADRQRLIAQRARRSLAMVEEEGEEDVDPRGKKKPRKSGLDDWMDRLPK